MSWIYSQSTGTLTKDGIVEATGYSGTGDGRNNPAWQDIQNVGPIPVGSYQIGPAYNDEVLGPCVMHLDPQPDTETFGRSLFRIHGNNTANDASHGCVILGPMPRRMISCSDDKILVVVS